LSGVPLEAFAKEASDRRRKAIRAPRDGELGLCKPHAGNPAIPSTGYKRIHSGQTREWELIEYAQDSITMGQKKTLIILGHLVSEQAGMKYCAEWLRSLIPNVPVDFIAAPEPFWRPAKPMA
jgi:hypothetical protein